MIWWREDGKHSEKIPNPKHQISNKFQISIINDQNITTAVGGRFEF
jgi:hypothetical protein